MSADVGDAQLGRLLQAAEDKGRVQWTARRGSGVRRAEEAWEGLCGAEGPPGLRRASHCLHLSCGHGCAEASGHLLPVQQGQAETVAKQKGVLGKQCFKYVLSH